MPTRKQRLIHDLFARNKRDLFAYFARRAGREDASGLLQETFVRAIRYGGLQAVADPPAFLQQIAVNLTRDFGRRRKIESGIIEFRPVSPDAPSGEASPEEKIEFVRKSQLLRDVMETHSPRWREVFVLCIHQSLSIDEIARKLGVSGNMVRKHLRRAILRCRAAVD